MLVFLFWTPALLQDPASLFDHQFLRSYFDLRAFVRSLSRHRAPFRTLLISFQFEATADSFVLDVIGGAGLQLRQKKDREYISYNLSNKIIEWKPK